MVTILTHSRSKNNYFACSAFERMTRIAARPAVNYTLPALEEIPAIYSIDPTRLLD